MLFLECPPNSSIHISQDDSKQHLKVKSDLKFKLMDENHLFQAMGLSKVNDDELMRLFPEEITEYLMKQVLIKS